MSRLRQAISSRLRRWARRRQGADPRRLTLTGRRIYILPTGQGVAFGVMMFIMLLGAMNYNNSLGLATTFLLAGFGLVVMHHCHRSLAGLDVHCLGAEPIFAGQTARFDVTLYNPSRHRRLDVAVFYEGGLAGCVDLQSGERKTVELLVPGPKRGTLHVERFSLRCRYPTAMFQAWAWVYCDLNCLVYPAPAEETSPPRRRDNDAGSRQHDAEGDTDFAGLREYRRGDSPRHIAWKNYARSDELRVKVFAGADRAPPHFEWSATDGNTEQRLSQLCRWIVDADSAQQAFGLTLPALRLAPSVEPQHVRDCLAALARF